MSRFAILKQIQRLDPVADHQHIVFLSTCHDFSFDMTRSLEFALFRAFSVPSVGGLLDRTGEFQRQPQKRYDDTDLIVSELMERGYDSERGQAALRKMNQLHGRFAIANEDFLYVLSTFIYEPIRWNARFGWRPYCEREKLALFHFWRAVGRRMNVQELPDNYAEFERFNVDYERRHYRRTDASYRVNVATRELFVSWFPRVLAPLVRQSMYALMDDALLAASGFPRPSPLLKRLVLFGLRVRARVLRHLPPRRKPHLRTQDKHWSYPHGYRIEQLGPVACQPR